MTQEPKTQQELSEPKQLTPMSLRDRVNKTQRQIARELDVREQTISDWERGRAHPRIRLSQIKKMMDVYEATLDELIEAFDPETTVELN